MDNHLSYILYMILLANDITEKKPTVHSMSRVFLVGRCICVGEAGTWHGHHDRQYGQDPRTLHALTDTSGNPSLLMPRHTSGSGTVLMPFLPTLILQ